MIHTIATFNGTRPGPAGAPTIFVHTAKCGQPVFAVAPFKVGQEVKVGNAPHGLCPACSRMRTVNKMHTDDPTAGQVIPEPGEGVDSTDKNTVGVGIHQYRIKQEVQGDEVTAGKMTDDNGLGAIEDRPFG